MRLVQLVELTGQVGDAIIDNAFMASPTEVRVAQKGHETVCADMFDVATAIEATVASVVNKGEIDLENSNLMICEPGLMVRGCQLTRSRSVEIAPSGWTPSDLMVRTSRNRDAKLADPHTLPIFFTFEIA